MGGTRPSTGGLPWEIRFGEVWPEVQGRLARLLRSRGALPHAIDDLVQDVAVRALGSRPAFEGADDLFWWASTVGRRRMIDEHRKWSRVVAVADVPDSVVQVNPTQAVEAGELRAALATAVAALPAEQRDALGFVGSRAVPSTVYVRRHRARARLLAVVEAMAAAWGWVQRRWHVAVPTLAAAVAISFVFGVAHEAPRIDLPAASAPVERVRVVGASPSGHSVPPASKLAPRPSASTKDLVVITHDTPHGPTGIRIYDPPEPQPLACFHLVSVGIVRCVDYPVRP